MSRSGASRSQGSLEECRWFAQGNRRTVCVPCCCPTSRPGPDLFERHRTLSRDARSSSGEHSPVRRTALGAAVCDMGRGASPPLCAEETLARAGEMSRRSKSQGASR
jgi:hypothetical protein